MPRSPRPAAPLKNDVLHILLVLRNGHRHGYAIMQEAEQVSEGRVRLQPGALYRHLKRLLDGGLIAEDARRRAGEDARRRLYRLTPAGEAALAAELERMASVMEAARRWGRPRPA